MPSYARLLASVCALATAANAVHPVEVNGKDFVNSETGDRFQILGVDYQPGGSGGFSGKSDPLTDKDACLRDAALMQRLGVNTVRIYNMSPNLDHDDCMSIFNAAGIYLIFDVNSPLEGGYLDRTDPESTYNAVYFQQVFGIIEAFKDYPNTLGFFAGNEVINEQSVKDVPAYVRAVVRDMKDYIKKNADRSIPVGYSAADIRPWLVDTVNYFMCEDEDEPSSTSDFFGLNSYSWCGRSSFTKSGYDVLTEDFAEATLPVFFSEYGCNEVQPRVFTEVEALYGEQMSKSFSGGLIYEFTQEPNDYGLVKLNDNDTATLLVDYENLMKQYSKLDMSAIEATNETATSLKPPKCGPGLIKNSTFLDTFDLPKRPSKVQDFIDNGFVGQVHKGSLKDIKSQDIPQTIYDHNGNEVTGIRLTALANGETNAPGNHTSGSSSSSNGDDEESAAGKMSISLLGLVAGTAFMAML
ncbi:Glucanosyltransferase-domain-containing protein [Aspergillus ambiguus]|uniref:1,3-beta-glucanosyltransferase gel2 n=1 Tax=Aspergillus ambiguus TaxID=176160 RepID=UPI003CCE00BC